MWVAFEFCYKHVVNINSCLKGFGQTSIYFILMPFGKLHQIWYRFLKVLKNFMQVALPHSVELISFSTSNYGETPPCCHILHIQTAYIIIEQKKYAAIQQSPQLFKQLSLQLSMNSLSHWVNIWSKVSYPKPNGNDLAVDVVVLQLAVMSNNDNISLLSRIDDNNSKYACNYMSWCQQYCRIWWWFCCCCPSTRILFEIQNTICTGHLVFVHLSRPNTKKLIAMPPDAEKESIITEMPNKC